MRRATISILGAALVAALVTASPAPVTGSTSTATQGWVRVNQHGYLPGETKQARLMTTAAVTGTTYQVTDSAGAVVLTGSVPAHPTGSWSTRVPDVYRLDLSRLRTAGRYRITTSGGVTARSPWFRVRGAGPVFGRLLRAGVRFDRNQRDGADVVSGPLHRRPSHLLDRHALLYAHPRMEHGSDLILARHLHRLGGTVDVAGGWFDAGDYLKFTHSTAYNDVLLFSSARMLGHRAPHALVSEARYGLRWLAKMWRPGSRTLLIQVGIGSGNPARTFRGGH